MSTDPRRRPPPPPPPESPSEEAAAAPDVDHETKQNGKTDGGTSAGEKESFKLKFCTVCASNNNRYDPAYITCPMAITLNEKQLDGSAPALNDCA